MLIFLGSQDSSRMLEALIPLVFVVTPGTVSEGWQGEVIRGDQHRELFKLVGEDATIYGCGDNGTVVYVRVDYITMMMMSLHC